MKMVVSDGGTDYMRFPEPRIDRIECALKGKLEARLGMQICPLALKETYEEAGPFGIDLIYYGCQKGGGVEIQKGAGPRPCSLEYAVHCQTYNG